MEWKYYEPQFECDLYNHSMLQYSPWSGHRNFAYDFMVYRNPEILVELGSHYGSSLFSFAQAVKDHHLKTDLYAVDTWEGDDYTRRYDASVYESFLKIKTLCYADVNIQMLRCLFDEAAGKFADKAIDILHIDGSHHYDDVKHDFELWQPRVKEDGIVFFHDISRDKVLGETMGSCIYWKEIKEQYPWTLEFQHSFGLGLLFFNEEEYKFFRDNVEFDEYQQKNNELDNQFKDTLRTNYFVMKDRDFIEQDLKKQLEIKESHLGRYAVDVEKKEQYILQLESDIQKLNSVYEKNKEERDSYIKNLEANLKEVQNSYEKTIQGKDQYISELETALQTMREECEQLTNSITNDRQQIESLNQELESIKTLYYSSISYKLSHIFKK